MAFHTSRTDQPLWSDKADSAHHSNHNHKLNSQTKPRFPTLYGSSHDDNCSTITNTTSFVLMQSCVGRLNPHDSSSNSDRRPTAVSSLTSEQSIPKASSCACFTTIITDLPRSTQGFIYNMNSFADDLSITSSDREWIHGGPHFHDSAPHAQKLVLGLECASPFRPSPPSTIAPEPDRPPFDFEAFMKEHRIRQSQHIRPPITKMDYVQSPTAPTTPADLPSLSSVGRVAHRPECPFTDLHSVPAKLPPISAWLDSVTPLDPGLNIVHKDSGQTAAPIFDAAREAIARKAKHIVPFSRRARRRTRSVMKDARDHEPAKGTLWQGRLRMRREEQPKPSPVPSSRGSKPLGVIRHRRSKRIVTASSTAEEETVNVRLKQTRSKWQPRSREGMRDEASNPKIGRRINRVIGSSRQQARASNCTVGAKPQGVKKRIQQQGRRSNAEAGYATRIRA